MKKIYLCILALALSLSLWGCKSDGVKNVEAMIDAIGTVTADSLEAVDAARAAYEALPEEEKADVENHNILVAAYDDCMEQILVGQWVYEPTYYYNVEDEMYEKVDLTLNADMSAEGTHVSGQWRVEEGEIRINNGESDYLYRIYREDGEIRIGSLNAKMMRTEAFHQQLDEMFVTVEVTPENVADYCRIVIYTEIDEDDFGVITGDTNTYATLESTVYENGLVYLESSDDLAIELLIPEHKYKYTSNGRKWRTHTDDAEARVIKNRPYGTWGGSLGSKNVKNEYEAIHDITAEQISFGRVTGKITFIRAEYVKEIKQDENGSSRLLVLHNGEEIHSGQWRDGMNY